MDDDLNWLVEEMHRTERLNDVLWTALCLGLPIALLVGFIIGAS